IGINLGKGRVATLTLCKKMSDTRSEIALIQEPYYHLNNSTNEATFTKIRNIHPIYSQQPNSFISSSYSQSSTRIRACIYYQGDLNMSPRLVAHLSTTDCTVAIWKSNIILVSFYLDVQINIAHQLAHLDKI